MEELTEYDYLIIEGSDLEEKTKRKILIAIGSVLREKNPNIFGDFTNIKKITLIGKMSELDIFYRARIQYAEYFDTTALGFTQLDAGPRPPIDLFTRSGLNSNLLKAIYNSETEYVDQLANIIFETIVLYPNIHEELKRNNNLKLGGENVFVDFEDFEQNMKALYGVPSFMSYKSNENIWDDMEREFQRKRLIEAILETMTINISEFNSHPDLLAFHPFFTFVSFFNKVFEGRKLVLFFPRISRGRFMMRQVVNESKVFVPPSREKRGRLYDAMEAFTLRKLIANEKRVLSKPIFKAEPAVKEEFVEEEEEGQVQKKKDPLLTIEPVSIIFRYLKEKLFERGGVEYYQKTKTMLGLLSGNELFINNIPASIIDEIFIPPNPDEIKSLTLPYRSPIVLSDTTSFWAKIMIDLKKIFQGKDFNFILVTGEQINLENTLNVLKQTPEHDLTIVFYEYSIPSSIPIVGTKLFGSSNYAMFYIVQKNNPIREYFISERDPKFSLSFQITISEEKLMYKSETKWMGQTTIQWYSDATLIFYLEVMRRGFTDTAFLKMLLTTFNMEQWINSRYAEYLSMAQSSFRETLDKMNELEKNKQLRLLKDESEALFVMNRFFQEIGRNEKDAPPTGFVDEINDYVGTPDLRLRAVLLKFRETPTFKTYAKFNAPVLTKWRKDFDVKRTAQMKKFAKVFEFYGSDLEVVKAIYNEFNFVFPSFTSEARPVVDLIPSRKENIISSLKQFYPYVSKRAALRKFSSTKNITATDKKPLPPIGNVLFLEKITPYPGYAINKGGQIFSSFDYPKNVSNYTRIDWTFTGADSVTSDQDYLLLVCIDLILCGFTEMAIIRELVEKNFFMSYVNERYTRYIEFKTENK